jgi:hypothetical protein
VPNLGIFIAKVRAFSRGLDMAKQSSAPRLRSRERTAQSNTASNSAHAAHPLSSLRPANTVVSRKFELVPPTMRHELVSVAAYFRAEARGFAPGHEAEDWLAAEQEINEMIVRRYAL